MRCGVTYHELGIVIRLNRPRRDAFGEPDLDASRRNAGVCAQTTPFPIATRAIPAGGQELEPKPSALRLRVYPPAIVKTHFAADQKGIAPSAALKHC